MQLVKTNERGRRIGESHPRAVLTDHDVALLLDLLIERDALVGRMEFDGALRSEIDKALREAQLSYSALARMFNVCKSCIFKIDNGQRRCQVACP